MKDNVKMGMLVLGGYVLGRTKKGKSAIRLALWASGVNPRDMMRDRVLQVAKSPELGRLTGELTDPLVAAVRRAAIAAVEARVTGLASSLEQRTAALKDVSGKVPGKAGEEKESDEESGEESESESGTSASDAKQDAENDRDDTAEDSSKVSSDNDDAESDQPSGESSEQEDGDESDDASEGSEKEEEPKQVEAGGNGSRSAPAGRAATNRRPAPRR